MYPNKVQTQEMIKVLGAVRYTYNYNLDKWTSMWNMYKQDHTLPKPCANLLNKLWTKEKPDWAKGVAHCILHNAIIDLGTAYTNFFKKISEKPVYHKRGKRDSFRVDNDKARILQKQIRLPKIGWIKLAEELRYTGKILFYTVSTYAGEWYVSVWVELPDTETTVPDSVVGVDVGLEKHPAYASDGTKLELPLDTLKKLERKLKRA